MMPGFDAPPRARMSRLQRLNLGCVSVVLIPTGIFLGCFVLFSVLRSGIEGLWLRALLPSAAFVFLTTFVAAAALTKVSWRPRIHSQHIDGPLGQGVVIRCRILPQLGAAFAFLAPGLWCGSLLAICWAVGVPRGPVDVQFHIAFWLTLLLTVVSLGNGVQRVVEVARGRLVRGYVALTPRNVRLRLPNWRADLAWEEIVRVDAEPNKVIRLYTRVLSPVRWTSTVWPKGLLPGDGSCVSISGPLLVPDPAQFVEVLQHYLTHPELRDELGDERGVRRLLS